MSVCDNQKDFNKAVREAVKYVEKKERLKPVAQVIVLVIMIVLLVWAVMLALKSSGDRRLHTVLALVLSPAYIVAHYLNN